MDGTKLIQDGGAAGILRAAADLDQAAEDGAGQILFLLTKAGEDVICMPFKSLVNTAAGQVILQCQGNDPAFGLFGIEQNPLSANCVKGSAPGSPLHIVDDLGSQVGVNFQADAQSRLGNGAYQFLGLHGAYLHELRVHQCVEFRISSAIRDEIRSASRRERSPGYFSQT